MRYIDIQYLLFVAFLFFLFRSNQTHAGGFTKVQNSVLLNYRSRSERTFPKWKIKAEIGFIRATMSLY